MLHSVFAFNNLYSDVTIQIPAVLSLQFPQAHISSNKWNHPILAKNTGHAIEEIERDTDRNNWMFAEDALEYGIIDHIIADE